MLINHINLCSSDVPALTDTLVKHFGFEVIQEGDVPKNVTYGAPGKYAMLRDKNEFYVVITQIERSAGSAYPTGFHFAVMLDSTAEVRAKHEELLLHGFELDDVHEFNATGAAWTAFYFQAGDGLKIEVNSCSKRISELSCDSTKI